MIADLAGRRYVVTGANTGVGRATAEALALRGADVVLACRSAERAAPVIDRLRAIPSAGEIDLLELDLADLASVSRAATALAARRRQIDVLINNAAVAGARGLTADGFELAFGTNYLGHYLLTRSVLPLLRPGARIVHLSSGSHARAPRPDLDALRSPTSSLTGITEYAVSKLCVVLFHHELARRLDPRITTLAADPGDVASDAWRHVPRPIRWMLTRSMKPPSEGARTTVFCATDPSLDGATGRSYVDCRQDEPSALSRDPGLARELWDRSAAWASLSLDDRRIDAMTAHRARAAP
jgi:retinol dehydrogenase-12